ncbi:GSCOCG00009033001-RA-CDS [Cotesia congregata]|nr:GSCOCG00009033001-RA-CDS [Cotesia congregata]
MEDLNEVNPKDNLIKMEPCNCGDIRCLSKEKNPIKALEWTVENIFGLILSIKIHVKVRLNSLKLVMEGVTDDDFKKIQKEWAYAKYGSGCNSTHLFLDLKRIENCNTAQTILKNNQENEKFKKYLLWKQKHAKVVQKFLSVDKETVYSYKSQVSGEFGKFYAYQRKYLYKDDEKYKAYK